MGKVILTKQQAVALEYAIDLHKRSGRDGKSSVVNIHSRQFKTDCRSDEDFKLAGRQWAYNCAGLNGLPLDTIIQALYGGYEVELTPEEQIEEYLLGLNERYADWPCKGMTRTQVKGEMTGAVNIMRILGMEIPTWFEV